MGFICLNLILKNYWLVTSKEKKTFLKKNAVKNYN